MILRYLFYSLLILSCSIPCKLSGQLNIKVGYSGAWPRNTEINEVITRFNNGIGQNLEQPMDVFNSMHGLTVGLRYRTQRVGIEASWQSLSDRSSYTGLIGNTSITDKWYLSETEYSLGLENYYGIFGYGASIGYGTLRLKTDIAGSKKKREVVNDSAPLGKFYLIFQYASTNVAAAIKPYIQFPLGDYEITAFDKDLFSTYDPSYTPAQNIFNRNTSIGVSIVLYNGAQE